MKNILSLALAALALFLLAAGTTACFAEEKSIPSFIYPGGNTQSFPLQKPGVTAVYRTNGTLESYQWKDEQGHMKYEFQLGTDGKTVVSGKEYFDNGKYTPCMVYETLPDKTIKESAIDRDGTSYREEFWYPDGKTCYQYNSYINGGKHLRERVTGPNPLVKETWYSNLALRTQWTATKTEKAGEKAQNTVDKVFRKDGTLLTVSTTLRKDDKFVSQTCEEYSPDGKTLLRKVSIGREQDDQYFGGYKSVPLTAEEHLPDGSIRQRTLRSDWTVSHEEVTDKDGKVTSTIDYPAEKAPTEANSFRRQRPDDDKTWWWSSSPE